MLNDTQFPRGQHPSPTHNGRLGPEGGDITGLILAGGVGRRMGGRDKGLVELDGRPLAGWTADTLRPQVNRLWISANRNAERYALLADRVIADRLDGYQGPLAGIAAALAVLETPWLLTSPCDTPLLPADLGSRLATALGADPAADIAIAADTERWHPLHALLSARLAPGLDAYLAAGGRSVHGWLARLRVTVVSFDDATHAFANHNDSGELAALTSRAPTATQP